MHTPSTPPQKLHKNAAPTGQPRLRDTRPRHTHPDKTNPDATPHALTQSPIRNPQSAIFSRADATHTNVHRVVERAGRVAIVQRGSRYWISFVHAGQTIRKPCGADLHESVLYARQIDAALQQEAPVFLDQIATGKPPLCLPEQNAIPMPPTRQRALDRIGRVAITQRGGRFGVSYTENGRTIRKTCSANLEEATAVAGQVNAELHFDRMRIDDAKPIHPLTPDEEARFWQHCDPWAARLFSVLAYTGMRPGELETLMLHDLDLAQNILHIRGKPEFHFFTKTRNARVVPLIDEVREAIRNSIEGRSAGPVFLRRNFAPGRSGQIHGQTLKELQHSFEAFLAKRRQAALRDKKGWNREAESRAAKQAWLEMGAVRTRDIRREFIRIATRAGLEGRTCVKNFRHTWATTLQVARVDPFARRDMMGHTGLLMTGHYTHTSPEVLKAEAQRARETRQQGIAALQERLNGPCT